MQGNGSQSLPIVRGEATESPGVHRYRDILCLIDTRCRVAISREVLMLVARQQGSNWRPIHDHHRVRQSGK